jgi:hypothetical protein
MSEQTPEATPPLGASLLTLAKQLIEIHEPDPRPYGITCAQADDTAGYPCDTVRLAQGVLELLGDGETPNEHECDGSDPLCDGCRLRAGDAGMGR